jgi:hypothetical protein
MAVEDVVASGSTASGADSGLYPTANVAKFCAVSTLERQQTIIVSGCFLLEALLFVVVHPTTRSSLPS